MHELVFWNTLRWDIAKYIRQKIFTCWIITIYYVIISGMIERSSVLRERSCGVCEYIKARWYPVICFKMSNYLLNWMICIAPDSKIEIWICVKCYSQISGAHLECFGSDPGVAGNLDSSCEFIVG